MHSWPPSQEVCAGAGAASSTILAALQFFAAAQCAMRAPCPPQATVTNQSTYDFIVVGAGTAGSVMAARLSELPNVNVLLIEAGGDPPIESMIPGFMNTLKKGPYDWNFTSINDHHSSQALTGGRQKLTRGKMLGGTGSINDMVYTRGIPADYEDWAATLSEADHWRWPNVLEYFKKTEHMTDQEIINNPELMKYHGRDGAIEVSGSKDKPFVVEKFIEAFNEMGFKIVKDMTNPEEIGVGRFSHTIRDGVRDSSLTALLNTAGVRDNLFVLKHAFATKILIDGNNTAYGVKVLYEDELELIFYANKEVIVSAGAYDTPKLLLLSGIGPKNHLKEMGIELVKDLPVGENLQDHTMVLNYLAADNGTCYVDQPTVYFNMIRYMFDKSGDFAANNGIGAYLSLNQTSTPNVPDFVFVPVCIPVNSGFFSGCTEILGFKRSICMTLDSINQKKELLSVAVIQLKPNSRGTVKLNSANPLDLPKIFTGSFQDAKDLEGYPEAMSVVERLAETSYFKQKGASLVDFEISGCKESVGSEQARCRARALGTSAWHAVGSAAMGAVVDSSLRARGLRALRVVDASVMPAVVRGNINAPVVMIAEVAADLIKAEHALG